MTKYVGNWWERQCIASLCASLLHSLPTWKHWCSQQHCWLVFQQDANSWLNLIWRERYYLTGYTGYSAAVSHLKDMTRTAEVTESTLLYSYYLCVMWVCYVHIKCGEIWRILKRTSHGYLSLYLFLFATTLFLAKALSSLIGCLHTDSMSCTNQ